tara:strand:+ start:217 stop:402 length:186 start_codon:yes stop_codon:yes gene_type:complete
MFEEKKLTEEDQERVNSYLKSGFNSVERSPFRPLRLLVLVWVVVAILGFVSWYIGKQAGYL